MKKLAIIFTLGTMLFSGCSDEIDSNLSESQSNAINDQSVTEAYFNEAGDMSTMAYNEPEQEDLSGGRSKSSITITVEGDTRFNGAIVTLTPDENSQPLSPKGNIVIDFGTGQTDPKGVERKGKILVAYQGIRFIPQSFTEITFENYYVNDVKIEGKRKVTTTDLTASPSLTIKFAVVDSDGKATFEDGTFITRNAAYTHTVVFGGTAAQTTWTVAGQASGKTRSELDYTFTINRDLVFRLDCALNGIAIPAEGQALFTLGTEPITLNYGDDGAGCDRDVVVSLSGISQTITVN